MAALLRLEPSRALKEKRLQDLLAARSLPESALLGVVRDAQLLGSLELAGVAATWAEVRSPRPPALVEGLRRAQQSPESGAALHARTLLAWQAEVTLGEAGYRTRERVREGGPPPAPPEFIPGRVELLEQWLGMDSLRELGAPQAGALVLARIVEILPFDDANGRVSRLAASHLMVKAGARPPILVKGDRPRLEGALQAAFRLDTEPLARLLDEASARGLDVMIQELQGRVAAPDDLV